LLWHITCGVLATGRIGNKYHSLSSLLFPAERLHSLPYSPKTLSKSAMNERLFLKLLLALFSSLMVAELLVALRFGFRLELMLFCFIMALALTGILVVARLLGQQRTEIDSVSARRAAAKRSGLMRDRLRDYAVDEEFLGGESFARSTKRVEDSPLREALHRAKPFADDSATTIEESIKLHAAMYGGLEPLRQMMESIDEASLVRLVKKAGFGDLSREEVMVRITLMIEQDGQNLEGERSSALENHSMEKESFDDYIQRCMGGTGDADCADGFSVELDSAALAKGAGVPPTDFSHDPKAAISRLKRAGSDS